MNHNKNKKYSVKIQFKCTDILFPIPVPEAQTLNSECRTSTYRHSSLIHIFLNDTGLPCSWSDMGSFGSCAL